jgi:hypothetical protein
MLDYQMVMVAREVSRERVQGQPTVPGRSLVDFAQATHRAVIAFLATLAEKSVNLVLAQRYQNRHRSVEGRT